MDGNKICPRCGAASPLSTKFCENCGNAFPIEQPVISNAAPQGAYTQPAVGAQPPMGGAQPAGGAQPYGASYGTTYTAQNPNVYATPAAQMQLQQPKKGSGGLVAAIIVVLLLLFGGGVAAAGFAFGWFDGKKASEIEVTETKLKLEVGEVASIDISNYDDLGKNITLSYETDDKKIVKIIEQYDDGFDIEAVSSGVAWITVSGGNYEDVLIKVTVKEPTATAPAETASQPGGSPSSSGSSASSSSSSGTSGSGSSSSSASGSSHVADESMGSYDENADGSLNLWSQYTNEIVAQVQVLSGYTLDREYSSEMTVFCDSDSQRGIYYTCYSEMPFSEWAYVRWGDIPEESPEFQMDIDFDGSLGLRIDGETLHYAYRYDPENQYGETEMYYIYYEYEYEDDGYVSADYVTIELYPEQAASWGKTEFKSFAEAVFGL